jgi:hypothetical protein
VGGDPPLDPPIDIGGDGWFAAFLPEVEAVVLAHGRGGGRSDALAGRSEVHLRLQGPTVSPAQVVSAVAASSSSTGASVLSPSSALRRNVAFLVLLAAIGLAAMVVHQWRVGSGAARADAWDQFRQRWTQLRRSRT